MDENEARLVLSELAKRTNQRATKHVFFDPKFPKQTAFIKDRSNLMAGLTTRRAGKSYGAGLKVHDVLFNIHPGSMALYIGLTRDAARRILWNNVVKDIDKRFGLKGAPHETFLQMVYPNGSILQLVGADVRADEMEKFLGGKYSIVIIDESASYRQDVRKLIYENLEPATADYSGQIVMVGTPSQMIKCFFADVTSGKEPGWSLHKWTTYDNPYMEDKWREQEKRIIERDPEVVKTPGYRRNRLAEWVIDDTELVYKFNDEINLVDVLPGHSNDATTIIGIDLGFDDATAFTICGHFPHDRSLYIIESFKNPNMIVSDVAATIGLLIDKYRPVKIVIDNASKQVVEELKQRHHYPLEAADKYGKAEFIELMNSDFLTGKIKLYRPLTTPLIKEYENLVWDENSEKRIEHASCENHSCFVAGTPISTPNGLIPIEKIKVGDLVNTRSGTRPVKHCITSKSSVIKLTLADREIVCTKDHPFWVQGKWIQAQNLLGLELTGEKLGNSTASSIIGESEKDTLSTILNTCIEKFGNFIKEKFLKGFIYTIKTKTEAIITFPILSALADLLTIKSTQKLAEKWELRTQNIYANIAGKQQHGMEVQKVWLGIARMQYTYAKELVPHVLIANHNIQNRYTARINWAAVQTNVSQQSAEKTESTISLEHAHNAKKNSKSTNTKRESAVPLVVLAITDIGISEVYNLTVETDHEYYAHGVLVSNCDATLYSWRYAYNYLESDKDKQPTNEDERMDAYLEAKSQAMIDEQENPKRYWEGKNGFN